MFRGRHNHHPAPRGGTTTGLLVTLSIIGVLSAAAIFVAPRYLAAGVTPPRGVPARHGGHQDLIETLAELIARSVGVIAINERGGTPYAEVVIWLTDDEGGTLGRADDPEIAVLSHSPVLQTITLYRMPAGDPPARLEAGTPGRPAWCDRFRADPRVAGVVLARGVTDMRLEPVGGAEDEWGASGPWGGFQRLRLTLTWAPDSVDGADEASVLVDTVTFPSGAGADS